MNTKMYIYIHIRGCVYIHTYLCMYINIYKHLTYIYMCIYIYIYVYIYKYISIYMSGRLYLLMDWHNGGHLLRLLHEKSPFTENETRFYLSELVAAIEGLFC